MTVRKMSSPFTVLVAIATFLVLEVATLFVIGGKF